MGKHDRSELTHTLASSEQDTACEKSVLYYDLDLITYKVTEFALVIFPKTLQNNIWTKYKQIQ